MLLCGAKDKHFSGTLAAGISRYCGAEVMSNCWLQLSALCMGTGESGSWPGGLCVCGSVWKLAGISAAHPCAGTEPHWTRALRRNEDRRARQHSGLCGGWRPEGRAVKKDNERKKQ